jgi:hypothetical protein
MVRRFGDPVLVKVSKVDSDGDTVDQARPAQFLWRDRLYVVRAVLAHWVEAGAWWRRRGPDGLPMTIDAVEHEVWRVEADTGRSGVRGVYDLVHQPARDDAAGDWTLARTLD